MAAKSKFLIICVGKSRADLAGEPRREAARPGEGAVDEDLDGPVGGVDHTDVGPLPARERRGGLRVSESLDQR